MTFMTVLMPRADLLCSFLEPSEWLSLHKAGSVARNALSRATIQVSIADVLKQITVQCSIAEKPGKDEFSRLEYALRLVVIQQPSGDVVLNVFAELLKRVDFWFSHDDMSIRMRETGKQKFTNSTECFFAV